MCLSVNPEFAHLEAVGKLSSRELEELVSFCAVNGEFKLFLVLSLKLICLCFLVDNSPCLVVVRTFELPAYRIAAGIVVGITTSNDRVLLNSNGLTSNHDSPCIT